MAVLTTGDINVPTQLITPWLGKVANGSAVAALSGAIPMQFGAGETMVFDSGEAEYVGEGQNKGSSDVTDSTQTVKPFKFQKTVRWTEEVKWADEDYQMGVIEQILDSLSPAMSRALDYGVFHGINPATGAAVAAMTAKLSAAASVEYVAADAPYVAIDAADALVLAGGYNPSDIAIDPAYAAKFSGSRTSEGIKRYPDFQLSTDVSQLENHRASTTNTVGALGVAAVDSDIIGFVGDFSTVRWGIQRAIPLEMIEFGDPDGQGDLKRNNQVAFRVEVVYGWGIAELAAIAAIKDAV